MNMTHYPHSTPAGDMKLVHRLPALVRCMITRIPDELQPPELRNVLAMAFDKNGKCVRFIEADPLRFHLVTGVREYKAKLYAGSVEGNAVAVIQIPGADTTLH